MRAYDGTLILITHDRMLLQDTVDELLVFEGGQVRHFIGTYREYLEAQGQGQAAAAAAAANAKRQATEVTEDAVEAPAAARAEGKRAGGGGSGRKAQTPKRKRGKLWHISDEDLEKRITDTEAKLAALDEQLADPDLYRDAQRFSEVHDQREALAAEIKPYEEEWLRRAEEA